jgi:vitamin K-dependent gamma-carboxylase
MALTLLRSRIHRFNDWLQSAEDGAGLAVFRIAFGLAMAWDAARFLANDWVYSHYIKPAFDFKYWGFEWVTSLSESGMIEVYLGMIIAGLFIAMGFFYRAAIVFYFIAHTYTFLLSATHYLNHHYLISVVAFMLMWMPAHRYFSIDALRRPELRALATPRWCRFTLQAQVAIVYFFGAIAKINYDWLNGVPIGQWMQNSAGRNPWAADVIGAPEMVPFIMWGGLMFDLLIVPALLWRRTRVLAIFASILFHCSNAVLFNIGVFPYMMLGATTLFLAADWPRKIPGLRTRMNEWEVPMMPAPSLIGAVWVPVLAWLTLQVAMPLRHHLYPGDVAWTEEGHYYSWRMKLRSKQGYTTFRVRDPETGNEWIIDPDDALNKRQLRQMAGRPELILQYAHHIADFESQRIGRRVEVRADAFAALNYREPMRIVDPTVDLAAETSTLRPHSWILPFEWSEPPKVDYSQLDSAVE